jgi:hypothetical protein
MEALGDGACPRRLPGRVGTVPAHDTLNGQPIVVRVQWTFPQPEQARWEQAFSPDDGQTWETNWIMDFSNE